MIFLTWMQANIPLTGTSAKANFTVAKATPEVTVNVEDIVYGNPETVIVTVNADGNVTIKVNNVTKVTEEALSAGKYELILNDLAAGKYTVEVTYNGNENYNNLTVTASFNVIKANTTVDVEIRPSIAVNESQVINITVNNTKATGEVIIIVGANNYTVNLTDGKANYTIDPLPYGNYTVTVIYGGDRNFTGSWTSDTFEVTKLQSNLTISVTNITAAQNETIKVNVTPGATGHVLITVDGKDHYVELSSRQIPW